MLLLIFGDMKLLVLIAIIGILHHVEAKAFQTKGTFDHMYENLSLKKNNKNGGYEMKYVPHVDGKPIFIPFDETFTPPNMLRQLRYGTSPPHPTNMYPKNPSSIEQSDVINNPGEETVKQKMHEVIDVTKAVFDHLNYDLKDETVVIRPPKKNSKVKVIKIKPSDEQGVKKSLKQETYKKGEYIIKAITKKDTHTDKVNYESSLKLDTDKASKLKLKENTPRPNNHVNSYELEEISLQPFNHDSPIVVEGLTKEIVDYPVGIEEVLLDTVDKTQVNKNPVEGLKMKTALYTGNQKVTKSHSKIAMHVTEEPILYDASRDQGEGNPEVMQYQDLIRSETTSKDLSVLSEDIDYPSIFEANLGMTNEPIDLSSHDSDYHGDTERDYNQDYDNPVIVEAFVQEKNQKNKNHYDTLEKKTTVMDEYESPVVVEALVKRGDQKEHYDFPVVSAALIKKHPAEHTIKNQISRSNKNKEHSIQKEDNYDTPVVVEALVKKNVKFNKKLVKYSTKMKPSKSPHYGSKFKEAAKNKPISETSFHFADQGNSLSSIKTSGNIDPVSLKQNNVENFSNDELLDSDNLEDVGSGIIKERSLDVSKFSNVWPLLTSFHSQRNKFKKCITPNKEPGNCMPIQMCPTPNFQLTLDDLMKKICTIDEVFIGICCPEFPAEILKIDWKKNISSNNQAALETKHKECGKIQEFDEKSQPWPWMAPLVSVWTRRIFCIGVLIKEQYVLTAAHCTKKIPHNQIVIVLGPEEFEVVEIKRHAQYNSKTMQNDLALLQLSRKVPRPFICLPVDEDTFVGIEALLLAWQGAASEEKLSVLSPQECRKEGVIGENVMCTQPRSEDIVMCNVDSGAPLIVKHNERYQVIGLLTWNRNDCDTSFPAIFTRVSYFRGWIENHST